jgi:hypothetical protein
MPGSSADNAPRRQAAVTTTVGRPVAWSDLVRASGLDPCGWHVAGEFTTGAASYGVTFHSESELARFLDFLFAAPDKPATSRLYRRASIYPFQPHYDLSNLRFQFDPQHQVAAAVVLAYGHQDDHLWQWRTRGNAGYPDVTLAHDSWNEHETVLPPESFITMPQLRTAVLEWAFGEQIPPLAVDWTPTTGIGWF